jgi:hypothetical protein
MLVTIVSSGFAARRRSGVTQRTHVAIVCVDVISTDEIVNSLFFGRGCHVHLGYCCFHKLKQVGVFDKVAFYGQVCMW